MMERQRLLPQSTPGFGTQIDAVYQPSLPSCNAPHRHRHPHTRCLSEVSLLRHLLGPHCGVVTHSHIAELDSSPTQPKHFLGAQPTPAPRSALQPALHVPVDQVAGSWVTCPQFSPPCFPLHLGCQRRAPSHEKVRAHSLCWRRPGKGDHASWDSGRAWTEPG